MLGPYPEHLKGASLEQAPALPITLDEAGKDTLAYYVNPYITTVIGFMMQAKGEKE